MLGTLAIISNQIVLSFGAFDSFMLIKSFKVCKERTMEKRKTGKENRDTATVFLCTFGVLPEVHFLHAIYHFKAQEIKNPTIQIMYYLELK
ncbi:hypothetical protein AAG906_003600 [Vitis piasezkii]